MPELPIVEPTPLPDDRLGFRAPSASLAVRCEPRGQPPAGGMVPPYRPADASTSPPARVAIARHTTKSMSSLTDCTEPSSSVTCTCPG